MGIANISGNILTDSGTNLSSLVSGSGTTNYLPKFTGASTIGNSQIQDDGTSVGIGGSPNASYKLAVTGAGLYTGNLNINGETLTIGGTTNNAIINNIASIRVNIDCDNTGTGESFTIGHNQTAINDSNVLFRVQDNGNVGIGTSSPVSVFQVVGAGQGVGGFSGATYGIRIDAGGQFSTGMSTIHGVDTSLYGSYQPIMINGSDIRFGIAASEQMRIVNAGVLMNTTTVLTSGYLCIAVPSNNYNAIVLKDTGTTYSSANYYQLFTNSNNSIAGSVSHPTSGTTSFNTSSDYRLKEDFRDFSGLAVLANIKFYDFKWKDDNVRMYGVKAHEIDPHVPLAVSGVKDAVDEEGNIIAQGVDYSKIVPVIGKALQEAMAKIEELEAKVTALENK